MLDSQVRFYDDRDYYDIQIVEQTILEFFASGQDDVVVDEPLSGRIIPQQTNADVQVVVNMSVRELQALRMVLKDTLDGGARCTTSVSTLDTLAGLEEKIR